MEDDIARANRARSIEQLDFGGELIEGLGGHSACSVVP